MNPYVGLLHDIKQGHPALCSDLIEEFRAPVVDALVTTIANKRILKPVDFFTDKDEDGKSSGCFMTDQARKIFVSQFEQRMNTIIQHPGAKLRTTWRGCIDLQISNLIKALRTDAPYQPLEIP